MYTYSTINKKILMIKIKDFLLATNLRPNEPCTASTAAAPAGTAATAIVPLIIGDQQIVH